MLISANDGGIGRNWKLNYMLEVLEEKNEIEAAQRMLKAGLNEVEETRGSIKVGYKGDSEKLRISWSSKLGIWWGFYKVENRFWNAFGTEKPIWNAKTSHSIICEINPPFEGINRRMSGVFAKDSDNNLYVLHRGGIGGGRPGIGKTKFNREYRGRRVMVKDGDRTSTLALVAQLRSPRFPYQIASFVKEVERIKNSPIETEEPSPIIEPIFSDEFSGTRSFSITNQEIKADCDHGLVANTLVEKLRRKGLRVGNTQNIDLFITNENGDVEILFEIKTNATTTNYYGAIGQLMFHSARIDSNPKLVAVFPYNLDKRVKSVFKKLGISSLTYRWEDDKPVFSRISQVL
jgi:hypothetical protein